MEKIRFKDAISVGITSTFISLLIFLMIEVLYAQILKDFIIDQSGSNSGLLTGIILGGFLLSMVVSIFSSLINSDKTIKHFSYWAALIAFLINFFIWFLVSFAAITIRYPEVLESLNFFEKIIAIPRILAIFSIYFLSNVTLLWIFSLVTYSIIFAIMLFLLGKRKSNKKYAYQHFEL